MHKPFTLRPIDAPVGFASNHARYFELALELLPELEYKCHEIELAWPVDRSQPVQNMRETYPELYLLVRQRDRLSDSVRVYSAMAIEGFLNWYGAFRIGESVYNEYFERMPLVSKAKAILLTCHSVVLERSCPLLAALTEVADRRNSLVHPKAREVHDPFSDKPHGHSRTPGTARESVVHMQRFFQELVVVAPDIEPLLP